MSCIIYCLLLVEMGAGGCIIVSLLCAWNRTNSLNELKWELVLYKNIGATLFFQYVGRVMLSVHLAWLAYLNTRCVTVNHSARY